MAERIIQSVKTFLNPILGNAMWGLITFLGSVLLYKWDIFGWKIKFGENIAPFLYAIVVLLILIFIIVISSILIELMSKVRFLKDYIGTTPNIKFIKPLIDERLIIMKGELGGTILPEELTDDYKENHQIFKSYFAHLVFANQKRRLMNSPAAQKVEARIRFHDENNEDLLHYEFIGRWGNKMSEPRDIYFWDSPEQRKSINIEQDDTEYVLDIAMKPKRTIFLSPFNNQNYRGTKELVLLDRVFTNKFFYVYVTLTSKSLENDVNLKFKLINKGVDDSMELFYMGEK